MPTQVPPSRLDSTKDFSSLVPSAFAKANAAFDAANTASGAAATSTPKISSIVYPGNDTAAATTGGQTVTLNGAGFNAGASVLINGSYAGVVSVANSTSLSFTTPSNSGGTYILYVINTDGGTGISVPGISYSGTPSWSNTAGSLATLYETAAVNTQLTATGGVSDGAITYSLQSGTLPPGSSLNSSTGLLSGTSQATESSTTYSFTIRASDEQNQDTDRAFSITINPDAVTWSSPADGTVTALFQDTAMSNVTLSATSVSGQSIAYTANALPTGVTISGSNVTGTPTVVGNTISVITATAANTNRTATRTFTWVVSVANDIYFKNVTLLLNGETTVTPFISDASTNSFGLTIAGDTKPVLFNPYTPGYYSNYFDGTGDYLTIAGTSTACALPGNFTIECWYYQTSSALFYGTIFSTTATYATTNSLRISTGENNNTIQVASAGGGLLNASVTFTPYTWVHLALVRSGTTLTLYQNGVSVGSATNSQSFVSDTFIIGDTQGAGAPYCFNGYMSNFRVVKGTAVYTSAFTPPTSPLTAIANTSLLTCQSNRLIDNSTNAFTITKNGDTTVSPVIPFTANSSYSTYGSTYFDGNDYLQLTTPPSSVRVWWNTNFTVECWIYPTTLTNSSYNQGGNETPSLIGNASTSSDGNYWTFGPLDNGTVRLYYYNGSSVFSAVTTETVKINQWNHLAFVNTSGTGYKLYVNGVGTSNITVTGTPLSGSEIPLTIGYKYYNTGNKGFTGYISDVRIVSGTAVYTANFTPSTTPLTAIANTSLLTLQYNGGATNQAIIDNSNFNNIITRNGNTSQGSFSPYSVTGWSNYFDGTGDYLRTTGSVLNNSAFTISFYFYPTTSSVIGLFDSAPNQSSCFRNYPANTIQDQSGGSVAFTSLVNQWNWMSIVGDGTNFTVYLNGSSVGSAAYSSLVDSNFTIGTINSGGDGNYTGYISNFRVKNVASVDGVPSTPLIAVSGTSLLTCQSNRFIDNSPNSFTLAKAGDVSVQALDPFGSVPEAVPISYSNYFDGTGDYLTSTTNSVFSPVTGDFTLEAWVYPTTAAGTLNMIFAHYSSGVALYRNTGGKLEIAQDGVAALATSTNNISVNSWSHVVACRSGTTLKLFINGVQEASVTNSTNLTGSGTVSIGGSSTPASNYFTGYLSNLRLVKGTAVYTTTFTPSTTPLTAIANTSLLTCQSTRMIDNSTNAFTLTAAGDVKPRIFNPFGYTAQSATSYTPSLHGGSAYFDGTEDYISTPAINWSTYGSYTFEFWIYHSSFTQSTQAYASTGGTGYTNFYCYGSTGNYPGAVCVGIQGTNEIRTPNNTITGFGWYHITYTYDGTTTNIFVNGIKQTTSVAGSTAVYSNNSANFIIGSGLQGAATFGYMSDVRLTKGTPLYTSNFVPPAQTLTNHSTTNPASLLLNFNNGGIVDAHGTNVLETVGNAQLSTAVKKYGSASMYFDGTGDTIIMQGGPNFAFGSGNFTIEFWVYFISTASQFQHIYDQRPATTDGAYPTIRTNNTSLEYVTNSSVRITGGSISTSQWYHVAVTRSSGSTKLFLNGEQIGSTYTDATVYLNGTNRPMVGGSGYHVTTNVMVGYIDDLRITKGYARYTSNFTPPSNLITK